MATTPTCPQCKQLLPTARVQETRASGKYEYPVIDHTNLVLTKGRWYHAYCTTWVDDQGREIGMRHNGEQYVVTDAGAAAPTST